jgi:hypothetical protein
MTKAQIPKYNKSLQAFSKVISLCAGVGIALALVGTIWFVVILDSGKVTDLWFPLLFAFTGQGLIGLAIAGALLRHTAKAIVEGLGGTIDIEYKNQSNSLGISLNDFHSDDSVLAERMWPEEHKAWNAKGKPSLKKFAESGTFNFMDWLSLQDSRDAVKSVDAKLGEVRSWCPRCKLESLGAAGHDCNACGQSTHPWK